MRALPELDVVVLTGFLGSGKTTLIRDFLAWPQAADTAVIVNEIGEVGLDGAILREGAGGIPMAMLANGCVCCQPGNDLLYTVAELLETERPGARAPLRRIILETSGVSRPGPVLRQLAGIGERLRRVAVVATYDPFNGPASVAFEEAAAQWAAAHRIIVTKTDRLAPGRLAAVAAEVRAINPLCENVASAIRDDAVRAAFEPGRGNTTLPDLPGLAAGSTAWPRISVSLARPEQALGYPELAEWLDNLAGALGERLLRVKGIVRVAESDAPLLIQSVGTLFSAPVPLRAAADDEPCFLVIIARDVDAGELEGIAAPSGLRFSTAGRGVHAAAAPAA